MIHRYDVVVVGAGPSGSTAALALARKGWRVALLDRATFPRPKICGNCVNPSAWEIWEKLGLTESFRALPHCTIEGFDIECEGRPLYAETFKSTRAALRTVARDLLDDWLRQQGEAAGVDFFPATQVTTADTEGRVITSAGEFRARLVFGADGRNSLVARQAGLMPPPRRCHRVAWQAMMSAPSGLDNKIHMQVFEEGYFGYSRVGPDDAVVSMVLDSRRSHDPLAEARRFLPDVPNGDWLRLNPITRAPARLGRGHTWLIGDSAHVVEPFTGEGISFALHTGWLAAEAADAGLRDDRPEAALQNYARGHTRLYRRKAWVNTLVKLLLKEPARTVRLLRHIAFPPPLTSFLARRVLAA